MHLMNETLEAYASAHSQSESATLKALVRETGQKVLHHRMLSGHLQGEVLSMISRMVKPKRILEIGTYTGYSAICLADGLDSSGLLYTVDINDELDWIRKKYFAEAGISASVRQVYANGIEAVKAIEEAWDLVFIDADKAAYPTYFESILPSMNVGGWMLLDNVLWSGKVIDEHANDTETLALRKVNQQVQSDPRVRNVLLPLRDGLMILEKLRD